jgi:UDP-N-acetylglucosamine:LPS N-acetylglucosamine transferase
VLKERPDVVATTGAAPGLVALIAGRFLVGAKTLWIDSIANCERLSSSGTSARRFADGWVTQWPDLSGPEGPDYWGSVI